jgi:ERCC4-type nuclease
MARVVIDTREKRGYDFVGGIRKMLPCGDYSVEGREDDFAVERKSLEDWVSTVVRSKRRFAAELKKLMEYSFAAVVIEGSIEDICGGRYRSEIAPAALLGITVGIMTRYHPVHVVFAGDRLHAHALVSQMLKQAGGEL